MLFIQTQAYRTPGGMQTYMRRIAEIMTSVCEDVREPIISLSVTDSSMDARLHENAVHYDDFVAASGNKTKFLAEVFRKAACRRHRVAVIGHLHLAPVGHLLKRLRLIQRYVLVLHGVEAWARMPKYIRTACRNADAIVATTRYTASEFQIQNRFVHRRMCVVPLALPDHSLHPLRTHRRNGRLEILSIGRLDSSERYKGFEHIIGAVSKLANEGLAIRLRIAGTGDDLERLRELARTTGPAEAIEVLGEVREEQLTHLYRSCDIFAMPSKSEGFGLVFLEAMRFGKPCVGGRHGGTPEVIRDGVDGFLVKYGDEDALVRILGDLSRNSLLLEQLGRNAYLHASSEYIFPVMRDRWKKILLQLSDS